MSAKNTLRRYAHGARGFTVVELMITVSIALFLVGGLLTILQNVRITYNTQQALVQLQDEQRFALSVITDAVQSAGYFPNPTTSAVNAVSFPAAPNFNASQVISGTHTVGAADNAALDTLSVRFQTALGYGPILCNGVDSSVNPSPTQPTSITLSIDPVAQQLMCSVNGAPAVALVNNVSALAVYYGVKRNLALVDYNVDTYETADILAAAGTDWQNISTVRIVITFLNPLAGQTTQPPVITLERVIEVMSRAGPYTS